MRKGMWSAAALVGLLSGVVISLIGPGVRAADTKVGMTDRLTFAPDKITVAPGTTVVWHNDGNIQHDVKAKNGSFDSKGLVDPGKEFKFTFNTPGTFDYFCSPHQGAGMIGTVTVSDGSTPTTTAPTAPTAATTATTGTTAPGQAATTTTTAKAVAGGSSTTSTTAAAGATTTTLAPAETPTSAPDAAGGATASTAPQAGSAESAADHPSEGAHSKKKVKNSPVGIAFASVSTLLLAAIAGKLLASKP